ncbi:MAG: flagellar motor stator protein MotA [Deltaproteobacteria bacterium]|nr:flagellar motor stator protein MotA [Deltaproteobacteria bacterium]
MFAIIGIATVLGAVVGGFLMAGGKLGVLVQPSEFIVIGGAVLGSFLIATPPVQIKNILGMIPLIFKGGGSANEHNMEILKALFEIFQISRVSGVLSLESHVEHPDKSPIFQKYHALSHDKPLLTYMCDSLKMIIIGGLSPYELDTLMESDVEVQEEELVYPSAVLAVIGDALPGLGIVAAVLGIVITMGSISEGAEQVGHHVAGALVGTFLGVLSSYGIVQPLSHALHHIADHRIKNMLCVRAGLAAFARGQAPMMAVEFARRVLPESGRPSFAEVEGAVRSLKAAPSK